MTTIPENYVGGAFTAPAGTELIDVVNPALEQLIGRVVESDASDVDGAVSAGQRALPGWSATPATERARLLDAFADALDKRGAAISAAVTEENGTPISFSHFASNIVPVSAYRYFAGLARAHADESTGRSADGTTTVLRREPVGVAALIVPWNGPLALLSWKLGPALAAGCTVVVKPSPETTLDLVHLVAAVEDAGFPPGVVNIVTGGRETGAALVAHPGVGKIAFTGSTAAGREIAAVAGRNLTPVTLELGGKSAAILLDDADLAAFTPNLLSFVMPISGQVCYSQTRILAARSRYDEIVEGMTEGVRALRVGDPLDPATEAGPLSSKRQYERVLGYLDAGRSAGAQVTTGGGRPAGLDRGYFVEPTVFRNVDNSMRIAQEEIFGPVLSIIPFDGDDEAVAIANDSPYGLGGSVFTADHDRGVALARRIEAGTVGVNRYNVVHDAPFGGYKASGLGRELGPRSLDQYLQTKAMYV